ncbi:Hca operon transcriptional activator HcaR [Carnimonas sp. R-84981]|uniref:LysR family transcriptional regulator n=1 Tax=Carnimonas bestiolae TaxID=3402172 RepID=UPI003EDB94AF
MFELNQLRCFVAVAEELHFRRAADRLNMTQPPLSRQIQLLEHQLGTLLLQRNNRSVKLTTAGRALLKDAYELLRMARTTSMQIRRVGTGDAGSVAIGFTAAASYRYLPQALQRWKSRLPDVDFHLREMVSMSQLDALENGTLDLALMRPLVHRKELEHRQVIHEPLVAALPEDDPLGLQRQLTLDDFAGHRFIHYSPDEARYFHELIERLFERCDVTPLYSQYVSQIHSILALVYGGMGIALVPESANKLRNEGIVYRRVGGVSEKPLVSLDMVWKKGNGNPALAHILKAEKALFVAGSAAAARSA